MLIVDKLYLTYFSNFGKLQFLDSLQFFAFPFATSNGEEMSYNPKPYLRGGIEMNNKSLKSERWEWTSFVSGMIFLSFLSGNIHCAEGSTEEIDPIKVKQTAISLQHSNLVTLPEACHFRIISYLRNDERHSWRLAAQKYRNFIDLTFFGPVYDPQMQVEVFSSETSDGTIGGHILNLLGKAQRGVVIASDQCANEEFLDDLLELFRNREHPVEIRIVTGQDPGTKRLLTQDKYAGIVWQSIASNPDKSGKMHNKFIIVDDHFVITGSPNVTYAAYNYNIESFVAIYHRFVARLYYRYYEYIISGKDKYDSTQDSFCRVAKMMQVFNTAPNNPVSVCLAPILDIKTFIIQELNASQIIDINMFIVSHHEPKDDDIVTNLMRAADDGAHITIKVDDGMYRKEDFMQEDLDDLLEHNVTVYTVSKKPEKMRTKTKEITTIPQFHDKLVLIQQRNGLKKVFIGSAGFTGNVQGNLNLENMVLLRDPRVYDLLLLHFNGIDTSNTGLVIEKL